MARNTARERLEAALARIDDPNGEGARACLTVYRDAARAAAEAVRRWHFVPATQHGAPVDSWLRVPIVFRLED